MRIRKASRSRLEWSAQCMSSMTSTHRAGFDQALQQQEHLLEQPRPRFASIGRYSGLAEFRQQPGQFPSRAAGQQLRHAGGAKVTHELAKHGGERGERQAVGTELQAAAHQHPRARAA